MRLPRFRVRTLLIAVAVVAVLLGGGLEYLRLKRLSEKYRYYAWAYGGNVRRRLQDLARLKSELRRLRESPNPDGVQFELLGVAIERLQADIAANANIVQIYEHAANHPWEIPSQIAEANGSVEDASIPRRFLTNPAPPEPYRPPEFDLRPPKLAPSELGPGSTVPSAPSGP